MFLYKSGIFEKLDSDSFEEARLLENTLFNQQNKFPEVISRLFMGFVLPYFKSLMYCLEDLKIERTSNKIENAFGNIFPKYIKKNDEKY